MKKLLILASLCLLSFSLSAQDNWWVFQSISGDDDSYWELDLDQYVASGETSVFVKAYMGPTCAVHPSAVIQNACYSSGTGVRAEPLGLDWSGDTFLIHVPLNTSPYEKVYRIPLLGVYLNVYVAGYED